jgi:hypothetical protein
MSPLLSAVLPSSPDRYNRLPTLIALLRFGFGLPGVPSAAGVVIASRFPFTATIVVSNRYCGAASGATTVARAGGSFGK